MNPFKWIVGRKRATQKPPPNELNEHERKALEGRAFQFANQPHPDFSMVWKDADYPPKSWYDIPETATDRISARWQYDDIEVAHELAKLITKEQFQLFAVNNIVGQICNGGFSQALYNSYGELAEDAVAGLEMCGHTELSRIVDGAFDHFGERPIPRSREQRIARLEDLAKLDEEARNTTEFVKHAAAVFIGTSEKWEAAEDEFYSLLHAKTHGNGYNAAFFQPLAEWIFMNKERLYIVE